MSGMNLDCVFDPKSLAIVGISANPESLTNRNFLQPLLACGYRGRIYPVNPHLREVSGLRAYPSIVDIPDQVDAAVCAVPARASVDVIRQCVRAEVKVVTCFTAGFSETGEAEGVHLEKELVEVARSGNLRIIGPNCLGAHHPAIGLTFESGSSMKEGPVGFLSQSGGNTREVILVGARRGVFFSKAISYGNAADLNEADFLEFLAEDDHTLVMGAYIEGLKQPQRFFQVLRRLKYKKPVIVLKGGKTPAGTRAVVSHTSSPAGNRQVWDAVCRQTGVTQVDSLPELMDALLAFSCLRSPRGRRVGILGIGGGATVQAADDCENAGLIVPPFPMEIRGELARFTPSAGTGLLNPVDTSSDVYWEPVLFAESARLIAGYEGVDMIFVMFATFQAARQGVECLRSQIEAILGVGGEIDKPMAVVLFTAGLLEAEKVADEVQHMFIEAEFPVFPTFRRAALAVNRLISYQENRGS